MVEVAKISREKINICPEVANIDITETTVTITKRMDTSDPSNRSSSGVNNTREFCK